MEGWFKATVFDSDIDCFGGYTGEATWFEEVIVVNDPGLESSKYASTRYFNRREIEEAFRKYAHLNPAAVLSDYSEDAVEAVLDAELSADQVNVTLRPPASQEA
jgi:hypothetical protein